MKKQSIDTVIKQLFNKLIVKKNIKVFQYILIPKLYFLNQIYALKINKY